MSPDLVTRREIFLRHTRCSSVCDVIFGSRNPQDEHGVPAQPPLVATDAGDEPEREFCQDQCPEDRCQVRTGDGLP